MTEPVDMMMNSGCLHSPNLFTCVAHWGDRAVPLLVLMEGPISRADLYIKLLLMRQTVNTPPEVLHGRVKEHVGDVARVQASVLVDLVGQKCIRRREKRIKNTSRVCQLVWSSRSNTDGSGTLYAGV